MPAAQATDGSCDEVGCGDTRGGMREAMKRLELQAEKGLGREHGSAGGRGVSNGDIARALARASFAVIM